MRKEGHTNGLRMTGSHKRKNMLLGDQSHPGLGKSAEAAWNRKNLYLSLKEREGSRKRHFLVRLNSMKKGRKTQKGN